MEGSLMWEILYCHVTRRNRTISPGHWFFHTGQWADCANACRTKDGKWHVEINFAPGGKQKPDNPLTFNSIEEVKRFVSEYFETPVTKVKSTVLRNIVESEM
jgi:hypothetical protein